MSKLYFRLLVLLSVSTSILSAIVPSIWPNEQALLLEAYLPETEMTDTMMWVSVVAIAVYAVLYIVETIALLLFVSWAKPLFIVLIVLAMPLYLLMDVTVATPLVQFFYDVGMFCSGMLLVLLYTDPVAEYFKKSV